MNIYSLRKLNRVFHQGMRPPRPMLYLPTMCKAQNSLLSSGSAHSYQQAVIVHEQRKGNIPTIVLGGFVPDSTEQIFLLQDLFVKYGSIYCLNYSRKGFSLDLMFAQLNDLVEEINQVHGKSPVIFSVSFGAGIVMDWLRRARLAGCQIDIQGLVLISPVACIDDILAPGNAKPSTLLGRILKPHLHVSGRSDDQMFEDSRAIFKKMFEAGAQNKTLLRSLMTPKELKRLYTAVMETISTIDTTCAHERLTELKKMKPPFSCEFLQSRLPLSSVPALILYSEKESSIIDEHSPTRLTLEADHTVYLPQSEFRIVRNFRGTPVQHASLIFHYCNFLPVLSNFYRKLKQMPEASREYSMQQTDPASQIIGTPVSSEVES